MLDFARPGSLAINFAAETCQPSDNALIAGYAYITEDWLTIGVVIISPVFSNFLLGWIVEFCGT